MLTSLTAFMAMALGQVAAPLPAAPPNQPAVQVQPASPTTTNPTPLKANLVAVHTVLDDKDAKNGKDDKAPDANGNGNGNGDEAKPQYGFLKTLIRGYPNMIEWFPKFLGKEEKKPGEPEPEPPPPPRRGYAQPFNSVFPGGGDWQGAPVPGQPLTQDQYPLTNALWSMDNSIGKWMKDNRIRVYGWVDASTNWTTNKTSNLPDSYWLQANRINLDQFVFKVEREVDTVQTDHVAFGFRSVVLYGEDYRFTTAGGWGIEQFSHNNLLYGWDPIEQFIDIYIPYVAQGMILRFGRWVACPDIETQLAPDNYMISHSILFTYDTYTQTGFESSIKLSDSWTIQGGINFGDDMAPWYKGAALSGFMGLRWVSKENKDSIFTCLNQINSAEFRHFDVNGQPAGHDNYNYVVSTWQHKFTDRFLTKTEGYFMWQRDAYAGGTVSVGPIQPYGGGGGPGPLIPGTTHTFGVLNYTELAVGKVDFLSLRNEYWRDTEGMRSGVPGCYTSHTAGITHFFSPSLEIRGEAGYYRNWTNPAFDLGRFNGAWICGADLIFRF
jgi:hypothetical protein